MSSRGNAGGSRTVTPIASYGQGQENRTTIYPDAVAMLRDFFGHDLPEQQVRDMVGASQGASVALHRDTAYDNGGAHPAVRFDMTGPYVTMPADYALNRWPLYSAQGTPADRYLYKNAAGQLEMHNATFRVNPEYQGKGVGLQVIAKEAKTLSAMGVKRIGASMAGWRGSSDQGFQVWPRMGYNTKPGAIESEMREFLKDKSVPGSVRSAIKSIGVRNVTLLDLYQYPEGRTWWAHNGKSHSGYLDLTPGSRSMQVLQAYVAANGLDWNTL